MRYENGRRTIVEYRTADRDPETNPALKTISFRELGRPECKLLGVQWGEIGNADYTAVGAGITPKDPWFVGTGFTRNDLLPDLVGYESEHALHELRAARDDDPLRSEATEPPGRGRRAVHATSRWVVFSSGSIASPPG